MFNFIIFHVFKHDINSKKGTNIIYMFPLHTSSKQIHTHVNSLHLLILDDYTLTTENNTY